MIRFRKTLTSVGLVGLGSVVALVLAELVLRAFWPQRSYVSAGMFEADPDAGYRLRGGYSNEVHVPEYKTRVVVDAEGYRVPVDAPREPLGASRILAIGDSFTFGVGVEAREAVPEVLERELNALWPDAWTVRNGGVGGYGPLRSSRHLLATQAAWDPDVVVHVLYVGNDLEDPRPETFRTDPVVRNGRMVSRGTHPLQQLRLALRARLHLYTFLRQHMYDVYVASGLARRSRYLDPVGLREWPDRVVRVSWPAGREAIVSIHDWCRESGARYLVVLAPTRWQVDDDSWRRYRSAWGRDRDFERDHAQRVITAELEAEGVEVLDLLPVMRGAVAAGDMPYFRRDMHWNVRGHEIAARAVLDRLRQAGWVGPEGDPRRAVARSVPGRPSG